MATRSNTSRPIQCLGMAEYEIRETTAKSPHTHTLELADN